MRTTPLRARGVAIGGALVLSIAPAAGPAAPANAKIKCNSKSHGGGPWYQGKTASNVYDTTFSAGPAIPGLRSYVPQAVTTWHNWDTAGHDLLVVSSYRDGGGKARLFGIDAATGKHVGTVAIAPTHAGGITITNGWAFVQGKDSGKKHYVRKYELSELRGKMTAKGTPYLKQIGKARQVYGSAFLSSYGDNLFAGRFNDKGRGKMYRYTVADTGALKTRKGAYEVPTKTQGLLVTKDHFIYSTSLGNDNRSNIYVVAGGARDIDVGSTKCFRAPSMPKASRSTAARPTSSTSRARRSKSGRRRATSSPTCTRRRSRTSCRYEGRPAASRTPARRPRSMRFTLKTRGAPSRSSSGGGAACRHRSMANILRALRFTQGP